jgi:prepilin-type N-terminal cleavage/methylation domain-containing protein
MRRLTQERGFTIVEMMIAVVVLLVGALGTMAMLDTANKRSRGAEDRQNATALTRQVVEAAKAIPYRDLAEGSVVSRLREEDALAGVSGDPWRIERANTTFTVEVDLCWLDERADGLGSRAAGNFCPGTPAGGTADGNSIDHKRVTVITSWDNSSGSGSARQTTLVSARGGIDAPGVTAVGLTTPIASPITDQATTSASFEVTTTEGAAAVVWSLDGTQQDTAAGGGTTWNFTWNLPSQDGIYDVSAQAFDADGYGGEVRSITVVVNRFPPVAPKDVVAVRNNGIVEIRWTGNAERDVIGYRVYRQAEGGAAELVCSVETQAQCVDSTPPPRSSEVLDYWVVAIDRDEQDQDREGTPSVRINVNGSNEPPYPPVDLVLSKDADGRSVLTWTPPAVPDPDGDPVEYVIYRGGTQVGHRHDQVPGDQTTYTDPASGTAVRDYWVATVDDRFAESTPLGPVTG